MTSLKTSLRNTGWSRHTPKITIKSDIPERMYHSRSRFSKKLMVGVGVSWSGKLMSFSLIRKKQKLTRTVTLICWSVIDLLICYCLNVVDFIGAITLNSCKTMLRHTTWKWCNSLYDRTHKTSAADEWGSYSPDLNPLDYCIWDILQDLVYEGQRLLLANLKDLKEAVKNKWKETPLRQFTNPLHNGKTTECS